MGGKTAPSVGVLALQGASAPHLAAFARLGAPGREVRRPEDLTGLTHLVLPGGESTTIRLLLDRFGMVEPLIAAWRAGQLRLFGTCAGAILLGKDRGEAPARLGLLDADLARNAYGRQLASHRRPIVIETLGPSPFEAMFIRAPKFSRVGPEVQVLARDEGLPVLVRGERILAATFHPELGTDDRLHQLFLSM